MSEAESTFKNEQVPGRLTWTWLAGIFLFALLVRLFHVLQINAEPLLEVLTNESFNYHQWATEIASGNWWGQEVFSQSPLYAYFLGVIYAIFGESLSAARICQAILGATSCLLLAGAGQGLFSKRVGILAGLGLAAYAPAVFFDGFIDKSTLDLFFLTLMLWLIGRLVIEPAGKVMWIILGASLGGLILNHGNAAIFIPALLLWPVVQFRSSGRAPLVRPATLLIGLVVVLLPVAMRNQIVGGEFRLTSTLMSTNFYISNNENANGTHQPLRQGRSTSKLIRADATRLAQHDAGREL
ncbi:MAG: glycosyltransferase family 39 protein [Planctomycetes bacterium]|nr:glycosyltransferase family 39 protein [Planctomycetota bacterium]